MATVDIDLSDLVKEHQADTHIDQPLQTQDTQTLELLAERATVSKETVVQGKVLLNKETRTKTINIPVTLTEHLLTIRTERAAPVDEVTVNDARTGATININGETITLGDAPIEIVLSYDVAEVEISTVVAEAVSIHKQTKVKEETLSTQVRHEELVVNTQALDTKATPTVPTNPLQSL